MYFVYMLECENGSIYTGIAKDVEKRFNEHIDASKNRKGAKYTRAFKPKRIVAIFAVKNRSEALSLESRIKKLNREQKLFIVKIYNG